MTPAEEKNLRSMRRKYVQIKWRDPSHDWPYFRLMKVSAKDDTIKLRGMDFPDGSAKHEGDEFWVDWRDIVEIEPVVVRI